MHASKLYTIRLTEEQFELLRIFVQYHDIDIDNVVVGVGDDIDQNVGNVVLVYKKSLSLADTFTNKPSKVFRKL
jgi:hypothetical protein